MERDDRTAGLEAYLRRLAGREDAIRQALTLEGRCALKGQELDQITTFAAGTMLPTLEGELAFLFRPRSDRPLAAEYHRLVKEAMVLYVAHATEMLQREFGPHLAEPLDPQRMQDAVVHELENVILPVIRQRRQAAEGLHAYILGLMLGGDPDKVTGLIAEGNTTPPQLGSLFEAVFAHLAQADASIGRGDTAVAASCLIDASHLLGLHRGATYVMDRLDDVGRRRNAARNSARSRLKNQAAQACARALFVSLRGKGPVLYPWATPKQAMEAIWAELCRKQATPSGISDRTLYRLCRAWCREEEDGPRPVLHMVLSNGSVIPMKVD